MHIHNACTCIIFRCLHILHMFLYISPKSQVTPQVSHPKTSQRRHAGPIPSWCGDRSRSTLDGAEEGIPPGLRWEIGRFCGECVTKSWGKPWGKWGKPRFSASGLWGSSQTNVLDQPKYLVNGFFLKWWTPSYQLSSQILHFLWGDQRFWGTPRLQFKAPHNCMG